MWYVIQVMTGKEDDIAGKLKEQGIRALVPKENRLIRSGGSWSQREYILFAGYVFLNMNYNADNYYKVKGIPGVIQFLGDSRNPSRLSYLEAEWIMLLTGENNQPIEPTVVRALGDGNYETVKGVLENLKTASSSMISGAGKQPLRLRSVMRKGSPVEHPAGGRRGTKPCRGWQGWGRGCSTSGFERSHLMAYG